MAKRRSNNDMIVDADDDPVYDEIDLFHREKDATLLDFGKRKRSTRKKEVLSVRTDRNNVDYEDSDTRSRLPEIIETTNKWGRKRSNFYGTSYVDADFGGVHDSDEDEMLDMEETDAIQRQKRLDAMLAYADFDGLQSTGDVNASDGCLDFRVMRDEEDDEEDDDDEGEEAADKKAEKKVKINKSTGTMNEDDELTFVVENPKSTEDKRAITKEIMKNKGLTAKRRKDSKHARIKNRRLYHKAMVRRRSQVPDTRREISKYDGEKRGIHAGLVRSVKLR